jgi:hypothetical protein
VRTINLDKQATEWLAKHSHKLPHMSSGERIGRRKINYSGSIQELAVIADDGSCPGTINCNPRRGSDIYTRDTHFNIETVQTVLSDMPGAPTFPIKQWLRYRIKREP